MAVHATHLSIAPDSLRTLLAGAVALGLLSLVTCFLAATLQHSKSQQSAAEISWQKLGFLLGPFTLAYIGLLAPRAMGDGFDDRYLLPLLFILLLVMARYYQERVRAKLPAACLLLVAGFGAFSITAIHDMFAMYRGYVSAIVQLRSIGTPATAILGPWEFEAWTEAENVGYANESRIRVPKAVWVLPPVRSLPDNCETTGSDFLDWVPAIKPVYAIVLDPTQCGGQLALPPVTYTAWIAPHVNLVYTVKLPVSLLPAKKPLEP